MKVATFRKGRDLGDFWILRTGRCVLDVRPEPPLLDQILVSRARDLLTVIT